VVRPANVSRLRANERLVGLYVTRKRGRIGVPHGETDAVKHEPSRPLRDT
jgi:hypothetical protein